MAAGPTSSPTSLPSFSIVLETENLAYANLEGLFQAIASLETQTPSPTAANEVLLIDSGDTPLEVLEQLCDRYPWLQVYEVPQGTEYYGAKMLGAQACTGDIVVYYDSDCLYQPNWLQTILGSFSTPEIQVVAGETRTQGVGLYGTAMAITYIFPQYSGQKGLQPSTQYFLNNVAFRRNFLLAHPIPVDLPLYRGNCVIHAQSLVAAGHTIWRQPQAQATHAPPNGLSHFFWRFLLIGYDYYWQKQLLSSKRTLTAAQKQANNQANNQESDNPTGGMAEKLGIFRDRMGKLISADWRHALFFPLSLPIILASALLIYGGYSITKWRQDYLMDLCNKLAVEI